MIQILESEIEAIRKKYKARLIITTFLISLIIIFIFFSIFNMVFTGIINDYYTYDAKFEIFRNYYTNYTNFNPAFTNIKIIEYRKDKYMQDFKYFCSSYFSKYSYNQGSIEYEQYDRLLLTIDNIPFLICDVKVRNVSGSGKNRKIETLFNGTIIRIEDNSYYLSNPKFLVVNYYNEQYIIFKQKLFSLNLKQKVKEDYITKKINNFFVEILNIRNSLIKRR